MKQLFLILLVALGFASCSKESDYITGQFPGITGAGNDAIWVVYNHTFSDKAYITSVLQSQTPPSTIGKFDTSYIQARQREVSAYSYRFYKGGELGLIGKSTSNENIWIKQSTLKWEEKDGQILIYQNISGTWTNTIVAFKDQSRLLFRFKKSHFGDTSSDKERFVMEVLYTIF